MSNKIKIFKIGNDYLNKYHVRSKGIFESVLTSSDVTSPYYCSDNEYQSEFTGIRDILDRTDLGTFDFLGICHYRTLIGYINPSMEYDSALDESELIINKSLELGVQGIRSTAIDRGHNYPNRIARARWVGSKSLDYISDALFSKYPSLCAPWIKYNNESDNSYRVVNVLPSSAFVDVFSLVTSLAPILTEYRRSDGTLVDRSVGYDLETLTSFMLVLMSDKLKLDKIQHTILNIKN